MKYFIELAVRVAHYLPVIFCTMFGLSTSCVAVPGALDSSFGTAQVSPFRPAGLISVWPNSLQFLSTTLASAATVKRRDGSVVVANVCLHGTPATKENICVTALTSVGTVVTGFGILGRTDIGSESMAPRSLALDRDENIWVGGRCANTACLFKLSPTGQLITTLGANGASGTLAQINIAGMTQASSLAMTFDEKIYVGGTCPYLTTTLPCAIRMNANGAPDATFNGGNVLLWGNDSGLSSGELVSGEVLKIKAFGDGRAYAAGHCTYPRSYLCLAIIETNGSLQLIYTGNAQDGFDVSNFYIAFVPGSTNETFSDVAVHTDGSAVLLGTCKFPINPQNDRLAPCLTKVRADSQLDSYFGSGGFSTPFVRPDSIDAASLVLREDGTMIVLANCTVPSTTAAGLCLAAVTSSGRSSAQFAGASPATPTFLATIDFGAGAHANANGLAGLTLGAARYDSNALMMNGYCSGAGGLPQACVARISLAPPTAKTCNLDIDGDGKINALTDGLLILRGMFGLSGDALTKNVTSPSALRDRSGIAAHLTFSCDLSVDS